MTFWTGAGGAALISGAGELVKGFLGKDSGLAERKFAKEMSDRDYKRNLKMFWQNWTNQRYAARNFAGDQMQDVMDTAASNGIHRLAALGVQGPGYQPAGQLSQSEVPQGTFDQDDNAFMGDAISRALNTALASEEFKHKKNMDHAELELLKAQTKTIEARARSTELDNADKKKAADEEFYDPKEIIPKLVKTRDGPETIHSLGDDIGEWPVKMLEIVLLGIKQMPRKFKEHNEFRRKLEKEIRKKKKTYKDPYNQISKSRKDG